MLRRYLNDLPEPVVPLDLYEKFRDPLRGATKQAVGDTEGPQFVENFDEKGAIAKYQQLITELPPLNRQLLLYILDLLAVFAAKSDENRMNSQNLAAIFQPGMLSHPNHAMAPEEYRLNQCVIIFLIENQDHFLIGMQGTAADEKTVKEVQSGTPKAPLTPIQSATSGVNRSVSNASAGADSVRREGQLRRNRSVSSKHSKKDGSSTPNSPANATTPTTGGLGRSNTVPSKKSPALIGGKFKKNDGTNSPAGVEPLTPARIVEEVQTPVAASSPSQGLGVVPTVAVADAPKAPEKSLENSADAPKEKGLQGLFHRTPTDGSGDKRQPNKLRKKRIPGTMNISAHSSTVSLGQSHSAAVTPANETSNPMEAVPPISEAFVSTHNSNANAATAAAPATEAPQASSQPQTATATEATAPAVAAVPATEIVQEANSTSIAPDAAKETTVPNQPNNEATIPEQVVDENASEQNAEKEKKKRWRLSRAKKDDTGSSPSGLIPSIIGSNENADVSTTSFASSTNKPRKSFQADGSEAAHTENEDTSEGGRDSKGPIGWIKNKYREAKENSEQKRAKSPDASSGGFLSRGKSVDIKRDAPSDEAIQTEASPEKTAVEPLKTDAASPAPAVTTAQSVPHAEVVTEKPVEATTQQTASVSAEPPVKGLDTVQEGTETIPTAPVAEATPAAEQTATTTETPAMVDSAAPKQE